jgi:hypothetical protein
MYGDRDMNFQQEVIMAALDKMLNKSNHFSICDVDKLAKVLGVNPSSHPDYKLLSALHCVSYGDMSASMKAELPSRVMAVLSARFDVSLMAKALEAVSSGEIKDLPPIEDVEVSPKLRLFKK